MTQTLCKTIPVSMWVVVVQSDTGAQTNVFTAQEAAEDFALAALADHWTEDLPPMPAQWWGACGLFVRTGKEPVSLHHHIVDGKNLLSVDDAWKICIAPDTHMGVLYDPCEVMTALDGAEGFDHDRHRAAVEEWCRSEALDMTDGFSRVFWDNAPTVDRLDEIAAELAHEKEGTVA